VVHARRDEAAVGLRVVVLPAADELEVRVALLELSEARTRHALVDEERGVLAVGGLVVGHLDVLEAAARLRRGAEDLHLAARRAVELLGRGERAERLLALARVADGPIAIGRRVATGVRAHAGGRHRGARIRVRVADRARAAVEQPDDGGGGEDEEEVGSEGGEARAGRGHAVVLSVPHASASEMYMKEWNLHHVVGLEEFDRGIRNGVLSTRWSRARRGIVRSMRPRKLHGRRKDAGGTRR
jgi:hypothetical protein